MKYTASLDRDRVDHPSASSPCLDLDDRPEDYERDMRQPLALLEIAHMALSTLLNLSVSRKHQVRPLPHMFSSPSSPRPLLCLSC